MKASSIAVRIMFIVDSMMAGCKEGSNRSLGPTI
jgi:hypothetical protein